MTPGLFRWSKKQKLHRCGAFVFCKCYVLSVRVCYGNIRQVLRILRRHRAMRRAWRRWRFRGPCSRRMRRMRRAWHRATHRKYHHRRYRAFCYPCLFHITRFMWLMSLFLLARRKRFGGFSTIHFFRLARRDPVPVRIVIYRTAAKDQCCGQCEKEICPCVFHLVVISFDNINQNSAKLIMKRKGHCLSKTMPLQKTLIFRLEQERNAYAELLGKVEIE